MPDWETLVREQLEDLDLRHQEKNDVIAELAGHLEEAFESFCRKGMSEQDATHRAFTEVTDWKALRRKIYLARNKEDIMEPRVTQFWFPGVLGFALFLPLSLILESASYRRYLGGWFWLDSHPLVLSVDRGTPVLTFHISWIVASLLVGAIAAYLSRRAGGTVRMSLLSSTFPVLPFVVVFLVAIPTGLVVGHPIAYSRVTELILYMALGWVLAPAVALLAGGLLVHFLVSRGPSSSRGLDAGVA
jgi:hypothetical protein